MAFCGKCGAKLKIDANFCKSCGAKAKKSNIGLKESSNPKEKPEKKRKLGVAFVIFMIFILIVLYLGLNIWAIGQLEIDHSASGILHTISNLDFESSLSSSEIRSNLIVRNPTFVPVYVSKISYEVMWGEDSLGRGQTSSIFIMPSSEENVAVNFRLQHLETISTAIKGVVDLLKGEKRSLQMKFYGHFGPLKIPAGVLG